jgi:hypothetical protein
MIGPSSKNERKNTSVTRPPNKIQFNVFPQGRLLLYNKKA